MLDWCYVAFSVVAGLLLVFVVVWVGGVGLGFWVGLLVLGLWVA